ncbi:hypothetical protein N9M10_02730 [Hellea sp.]|nr:hypothetical protein [Hellea sp.]
MTEGFDQYAFEEGMRQQRTDTAYTEFTGGDIKTLKKYAEKLSDGVYSTDPIDKPYAKAAIYSLYKSQGLKKPKIFWSKSPAASIFTKVIVDASLGRGEPRVAKGV